KPINAVSRRTLSACRGTTSRLLLKCSFGSIQANRKSGSDSEPPTSNNRLTTMTISAKVEYACVAVLELAARYESDEPVRIRDIADAHGIPSRFLVQILLQLKGAGLVQ